MKKSNKKILEKELSKDIDILLSYISKINPYTVIEDMDKVFELIKNYEEEKISLNELSIQMKKYSKTFEKHSKNLDVEK